MQVVCDLSSRFDCGEKRVNEDGEKPSKECRSTRSQKERRLRWKMVRKECGLA